MTRAKIWLRLSNELLFSLNLALLIVDEQEARGASRFLYYLGYPIWRGLYPLLARAYGMPHLRLGRVFEFFALSILLAAVLFLSLRVMRNLTAIRVVLRVMPGLIAVAGIPMLWLDFPFGFSRWLLLDIIVASLSVALYLFGKWQFNGMWSALILAVHFGLWGWVSAVQVWPLWSWWCVVYPVAGLSSTVVWAIYFKRSDEGNQST